MKAMPSTCHGGIDWSWGQHAVCIIDTEGVVVDQFMTPHTRAGLAKITKAFSKYNVTRTAIERGDGPVVEHLLRHGMEVAVVSPRKMKSLRERYGSAGNKDDRFDAYVLADVLRTEPHRWPLVEPDSEATQAIRALSRARQDLVAHRVAVMNQLYALLQVHFPGAIDLFSTLDSNVMLAFLTRFPTASDARWLGPQRMRDWLKKQHYSGGKSAEELLEHLHNAPAGVTGQRAAANVVIIAASVAHLRLLKDQIKALEQETRHHLATHPDTAIFASLPQAAQVRTAELLAEIGDCRARFPDPQSLAAAAGVVPSTRQSGNQRTVAFRYGCNKHLRAAFTGWAAETRRSNAWAADTYNRARARGKTHPHAARIMANRWITIVWRCWQDRTPYDPTQHTALTVLTSPEG